MKLMILGYIGSGSVWTSFTPIPPWLFLLLLASIAPIAIALGSALGAVIERRRE